jgi:nitrite reductase/ring-hydroxylating ferredoxin subunit
MPDGPGIHGVESMADESTTEAVSEDEFDLCSLEELKSKGALRFEFKDPTHGRHEIGVFWDGAAAYAIENYCPHEFGLLSYGPVEPGVVVCPLHAAVFDLKTGECLDKYTYDTLAYETVVREDRVWVKVPGEERFIRK